MILKSECPLPKSIQPIATIETPQALKHVVENISNVVGKIPNGGFFLRRHR
jgi:hypothetical protein